MLLGLWAAAIALAPAYSTKALLAAPALLMPLAWWTLQQPARWLTLFFAAALLLPPLPIAIGDSGPHPCLLAAALGLFCGALQLREWKFRMHAVDGALLALAGVMLASSAVAALRLGEIAALGSLARVGLFGIPVYVYFYAAHGPARGRFGLYWIAVASALFACVDFYFQFPAPAGYEAQFVWLDGGVFRRAQGFFYEASTLGNFCVFFLVMIAVCLARPREQAPHSRTALAAGGLILFAALVLSYSRASLVSLLVALAALVWRTRRRVPVARIAAILAGCAAVGAVLLWRVFPAFAETYWMRLSGSAQYFFTAPEAVLSGRVASWRLLIEWILANPWQTLLGVGYKTLPYNNYLGVPIVADNMYVSLLVETGIAGLAALLWLHWAILRASGRAAASGDSQRSFYGTWMLCFWCGQIVQMLSGDLLTYWRVLPVYFWVLAAATRE